MANTTDDISTHLLFISANNNHEEKNGILFLKASVVPREIVHTLTSDFAKTSRQLVDSGLEYHSASDLNIENRVINTFIF